MVEFRHIYILSVVFFLISVVFLIFFSERVINALYDYPPKERQYDFEAKARTDLPRKIVFYMTLGISGCCAFMCIKALSRTAEINIYINYFLLFLSGTTVIMMLVMIGLSFIVPRNTI